MNSSSGEEAVSCRDTLLDVEVPEGYKRFSQQLHELPDLALATSALTPRAPYRCKAVIVLGKVRVLHCSTTPACAVWYKAIPSDESQLPVAAVHRPQNSSPGPMSPAAHVPSLSQSWEGLAGGAIRPGPPAALPAASRVLAPCLLQAQVHDHVLAAPSQGLPRGQGVQPRAVEPLVCPQQAQPACPLCA